MPVVAEGSVPNMVELQAQLASVNRSSDRRVQPLLRPGKAPGTTEVDLTVEDQLPVHGNVELNNKASANTSATRLLASLRYDNLLQRDHSLGLTVQTVPQKTSEVQLFSANYAIPLGLDQLSFSYLRSDSETAAGSGDTTVFGKGSVWGVRRSVVLQLADKAYHAVNLSLDYKRFRETVALGNGGGFATPLRYAPLGVGYIGITEDANGRWQMGANLVVGLRGLLSNNAEFADKRYGASSGFSVLKLDLSREQKLPWAGLSLYGRLDAQFTGEPLVSNEQMVAGGVDTVRGYYESSAVGDVGARATLELRSGELAPTGWPWLGSLTAHAFADGAALQLRQPLPGQASQARLLGTGFGLRLKTRPYGSLQLNLGLPLLTTTFTPRRDLRLHAVGAFDF
jgi:hemolysin activation/secretion protein